MVSRPSRIDDSLLKIILKKQKSVREEHGLDISFPDASKLVAKDILEYDLRRPLTKKEKSFFNL